MVHATFWGATIPYKEALIMSDTRDAGRAPDPDSGIKYMDKVSRSTIYLATTQFSPQPYFECWSFPLTLGSTWTLSIRIVL